MLKRVVLLMCAVAISGVTLGAQAKPAPVEGQPAPAAAKPAPEPPAQPYNIKIEVSITDQVGPGEPARKLVSMIVLDRQRNSIRSSGSIRPNPNSSNTRGVILNVDARPLITTKDGNRISLEFGLEYQPKSANPSGSEVVELGTSSLNERLVVLLESGKTLMVSQAADPVSDRKITVEVTATILR